MKKKSYIFLNFILFFLIASCAGYEPIFSSTSFKYNIVDHSVNGEKIIAKRIYSKLYSSSTTKKESDVRNVEVEINVSKEKNETARNTAGKILEYRIALEAEILIKDFATADDILNQTFISSLTYKVQDQYSDTLKLEKQSIENLINNIYRDLLIELSKKLQ